MGIKKPYKRTWREFVDDSYAGYQFLKHKDYAKSPEQYIRAFLLIQKDLKTLFDYIEPSDNNLECYSYRIHELLLRTCVEVEANCKAILLENGYNKKKEKLDVRDYCKINKSHNLSSYEIKLPIWYGERGLRRPFKNWDENISLPWYNAYNETKHNRHDKFEQASLDNLIDSICGLVTLLSAQFWIEDYLPSKFAITLGSSSDEMITAIGDYFEVNFPKNWPDSEKYDFTANDVKNEAFEIQMFDYNKI